MSLSYDTMVETFSSKLSSSLQKIITSETDVSSLQSKVRMNFVNRINQMEMDSVVFSEKSHLTKAHNVLMMNSEDKTRKILRNYLRSKEFFDSFTDFDLCYQSRIIFHLMRKVWERRNMHISYYNQLRKYTPSLPKLVQV